MMKTWEKLLVVGCALFMIMMTPRVSLLADELFENPVVIDADEPDVDYAELADESVTEEIAPIIEDTVSPTTEEEIVGEGEVEVGEGVTATFNEDTGAVEFYSHNGVLGEYWVEELGARRPQITSIKVVSGKMFLPADSSGYHSFNSENHYQSYGLRMFGGLVSLTNFDSRNIDTSKVTDMHCMFKDCSSLTSIDLSSFNTSKVTDMYSMFAGCSNLKEINLSGLDTSKVKSLFSMFSGCKSLTDLDLSGLNVSNVTNMCSMFADCEGLATLNLSNLKTSKVTDMSWMFDDCSSLTTLKLKNINTSHVENMSCMFNGCTSLQSLDLSSFNTSVVAEMDYMFNECSCLKSLKLNSFDTANVTDMRCMFFKCSSLDRLDLNSFDTSSVNNMCSMFEGCSSLLALDLSNFDTSKVTDMSCMFIGCKKLTILMIDSFDTSNVIDMSGMFNDCGALTNLNLSSFNTVKVVDMSSMFGHCIKLQNLNLSTFVTSNVTDMSYMFVDCYALENLDLSSFNTSKATDMRHMFSDCKSLTSLDLSGFNTANVLSMDSMFANCSNLTSLDLSMFDTSSVTTIWHMFVGCSGLKTLDLCGFQKLNVTDMSHLFERCSSLENLNLSGFDTSNVTNMYQMFYSCGSLESLDLSSLDTSKVTDMSSMFGQCSSLIDIELNGLDTSHVTNMNGMFSNCSALTRVDIDDVDTSSVKDMSYMFHGCKSLTALDLSKLDTSNVTNMYYMFYGCSNLRNIDLSGIDTTCAKNMDCMFSGCESLQTLNLSNFNTSNVTSMGYMFAGCGIEILDLSGFDMSRVTYASGMISSDRLKILLVPQNNTRTLNLPVKMYDSAGNEYSTLPTVSKTIVIAKTQQMAKAYENGVDPSKINGFILSSGPVEVKVGGKAAVIAAYYDTNGNLAEAPGTISWVTSSGPNSGKVDIRSISDYYECYLCEITGVTEGGTLVSAQTEDGRYATVEVNVISASVKETCENAGTSSHLSGSSNYSLARTKNGKLDVKDGITSEVMIDGASEYTAENKIVIKSGGELIIGGTLNAVDIVVKTGGYLTVDGRLNAETVTFEGGNWLYGGGFLKGSNSGVIFAENIIFKNEAGTNFEGQLIAKNKFEYKSSREPSEMEATLYIGGNLKANDHFTGMQGKVKTLFYGERSSYKVTVGKKSNLGTVYAASADAFHAIGIGSDNHIGAFQYTKLNKPDDKKWSFTATKISLENASEKSWEKSLSAAYIDLLHNKQIAVNVVSALDTSVSADESRMINQIAEAWIASVYAQGPKGLLGIREATFDLPFTLNKKSYFLRYDVTSYGAYGQLGTVYFGKDENSLKQVGITSAASITAFKTQATAYLAEGYVQEYYKFATGSLPRFATDSTIKSKLIRGGIDYVKKYMEKMLFQTLTVSEPQSYKQLAKTLKLGNLMLKGDVEGLWKFAVKEVKSSVNTKSVTKNVLRTAANVSVLSDMDRSENLVGSQDASDSISDKYLKEALIEVLGVDKNGQPDFSKQAEIKRLELGERYIQNINGIQKFTNLETLVLNNNEIKDISVLKSMKSLRYLDISGQEIQDISPLSGLSNLFVLDVSDNDITSVQSLKKMSSLRSLDISNNPISSLIGLSGMKNLEILHASGLLLSGDLKELSGLGNLQEVYMKGSGIEDLQGINTNNLFNLDVRGNEIANLEPVISATVLQSLDASENAIMQIPSLKNCTSLKELNISGNMLIDIDGIRDATVLDTLNVSACELTNKDMSILGAISSLRLLDISYNNMIDDISDIITVPTLEKVDATKTTVSLDEFTGSVDIIKDDTQEPAEEELIDIADFTMTLAASSYSYDGKEKKPTVTVKDGNTVLKEGVDYTLSYTNNINIGTATVKVEGIGNYKGEKKLTFTIIKLAKTGFSDVQDPSHAFYKPIYWAADAGITKGYPDGTFGIDRSCTRGEMIMFLWRYAGKPAAKALSKSPFKDVPKTHAFYNAIIWASQKGITKGYPDGTFGINRNVSRGECMMFLWRLRGKPAPKAVSVSPFKDVPKNHAFYNAILWGAQKKITNGYTSGPKKGTFGINENCTRGAIVTFLYRAK